MLTVLIDADGCPCWRPAEITISGSTEITKCRSIKKTKQPRFQSGYSFAITDSVSYTHLEKRLLALAKDGQVPFKKSQALFGKTSSL